MTPREAFDKINLILRSQDTDTAIHCAFENHSFKLVKTTYESFYKLQTPHLSYDEMKMIEQEFAQFSDTGIASYQNGFVLHGIESK